MDPLDVETSPDIGEVPAGQTKSPAGPPPPPAGPEQRNARNPREDEPVELADLLPTNEVDRNDLPPAKPGQAPPISPPKPPQDPPRGTGASTAQPPKKSGKEKPVPAGPADRSSKRKAKKGDDSKSPLPAIIGVVFLIAIVGTCFGLQQFVLSDDDGPAMAVADAPSEDDEQAIALDEELAQLDDDDEEVDDEALQRAEDVHQAMIAALTIPAGAAARAGEAASTRAEELAQEEEEDDSEQDEAVAQASGAAAAPGGTGGGTPRATAPADPPATDCPSGMVRVTVSGEYACVDAYEYPGRGRMPEVNVSWFDARRLCEQQGKRLCSQVEWRAACGRNFPYGNTFDADRCNTADADGFERSLAQAGSFPQCRSRSGAYDMSGNAHEWVEEQRVVGGGFDSEGDLAGCGYSSAMAPGSSRASVGFRCCADPT